MAFMVLLKLRNDVSGVAAIEFAFIASFLALALMNATDISMFLYQRIQVNEATQMGAQIAWKTCNGSLPATVNCSNLNSVVTTGIHSTSLSSAVLFKRFAGRRILLRQYGRDIAACR